MVPQVGDEQGLVERGRVFEARNEEEEKRFKAIVADRVDNSPFYQHMGMEVTGLGTGWSTFRMQVGKHLFNVSGIVHGGAIASIADAAAGVALATLLDAGHQRPVTVELKLNFCAPVTGGTLDARGEVIQKGNRIAICDIEVVQGDCLVAKGLSTQMIVPSES